MFAHLVCRMLLLSIACGCWTALQTCEASECKVMVVMSYEADFPWAREQKEGIESVLADTCSIRYFYLDTKRDFSLGPEKAKEAFELFLQFKPDGVIAADDDAQTMFVIPYLRGKVSTPVMFCGVNAEPETHGYPAANVSGILERHHLNESIALARQLVPSIKTIGFIMKESPVARFVRAQVTHEAPRYPVKVVGFKMPRTLHEALQMTAEFRKRADVLFMETLEGIQDEHGKPLKDREVMPLLAGAFGKATIAANAYGVQYGLLSAVVKSGQEQGATAARMLREAMQGTPVSRIPITANHSGKRMINVTAMKALGLHPKPVTLRGVELVRSVM